MKKKRFRSFTEARKFVRKLGVKTKEEWMQYVKLGKLPNDIPRDPRHAYISKDWKNWGDWLGTGNLSPSVKHKQYKSFTEARKFIQKLKLKNHTEWREYYKSNNRPGNIPSHPNIIYKNKGWIGFGDWLGTGVVASFNKEYRTYGDARKFVRKLGLKNLAEWRKYCKLDEKPDDIPSDPAGVYKNKGWKSLGDWLGTGTVATFEREYRQFQQARKFVHTLKIKNRREWIVYVKSGKLPIDIRGNPRVYSNFTTWGDWLGTGMVDTRNRKYRQFDKARKFAQSLKLKNIEEWVAYCKSGKKPDDIPADPKIYGSEKWQGFGDWLGTGTLSSTEKSKNWLPPIEARIAIKKIAKDVFGGKPFTPKDWINAHKAGKIPANLPRYLDDIYRPKKSRKK